MAGTKTSGDFTTIRRGIRVRHSADGVEGRITWANGVSVKIEWDDGEKVTWKRDELAAKGLEILFTEPEPDQMEAEAEALNAPAPPAAAELEAQPHAAAPAESPAPPEVGTPAGEAAIQPHADTDQAAADGPAAPLEDEQATASADPTAGAAPAPEAKKRARKSRTPKMKPSGLSALDAAAKILGEEMRPMGCQELIGAMAAKGYWTTPGGKTPAATLYSALLREMQTKGAAARFVKTGRGTFTLRTQS